MADILHQHTAADRARYAVAQIWLANWERIDGITRDLCAMTIRRMGTEAERLRLKELENQCGS
jgi:hypothetical protein